MFTGRCVFLFRTRQRWIFCFVVGKTKGEPEQPSQKRTVVPRGRCLHTCVVEVWTLSLSVISSFSPFPNLSLLLLSFLSDSVIHFAVSRSTKESLSFFSLMAETSALCFSPLTSIPSISRSSSLSAFTSSHKSLISHSPRPSRPLRLSVKASSDSGNFFADDSFGFFPWSQGDSGNNSSHLLFSHFSFPRFFFNLLETLWLLDPKISQFNLIKLWLWHFCFGSSD